MSDLAVGGALEAGLSSFDGLEQVFEVVGHY
jgi:hypothetical protein